MNETKKIKIAIIDDNKEYIESLVESLSFFSEIEICGTATKYKPALDLLIEEKPDLVFLDIEMPSKSGFELLKEVREKGATFSVIFYTAYDKYVVQALREQALDYILKPVDPEELKNAIDRYKIRRKANMEFLPPVALTNLNGNSEKIALPTFLGLQFIEKNQILLFQSIKGGAFEKTYWEAMLTDSTKIKLSKNISAEKILKSLPHDCFFQINQSAIINLAFLKGIVYKTHDCELIPPFDIIKLTFSRSQLLKMKEIFDVF